MISWMIRKWEYGDPEEPWTDGQRSGGGIQVSGIYHLLYFSTAAGALGSGERYTARGDLLFRPSSTCPACRSQLNWTVQRQLSGPC